MEFFAEPAKQIPIKDSVDVLVLGGGPAGFATAVSAARMGAKTLLIEQSGAVGGVATTGLMSHWTGATEGPLYEELLERAQDTNQDWNYFGEKILQGKRIINPEKLKLIMLEMLHEAGARVQLYTFASDVIMAGDRITGAIVESKSGREAIVAKVLVDATGDGDIAAKSGAEFVKGRENDGKMQPATLMFKVAGVDMERAVFPGEFEDDFEVPAGKLQELGRKHLPSPIGHVLLYPATIPGAATVNMTNTLGIDGTKAEDLTKAEYECRKQIPQVVDFLRQFVPGFEECFWLTSASIIGVRETRHFVGEYTITEQDIEQARIFNDWIVTRAHFNFDVHNISGPGLDETGRQKGFKQQNKYTIPTGCFLPKKIDGLLLAGRNISGTHLAHSNYRVMPICVNMGQGVGVLAALSVQQNKEPRKVNVKDVQKILLEQGVQV
ncbi:MAG: FAD-dependent oxidoreductase [bacterium]|nr:FAD-dependent oxidoreductase [bacterium]